jgi:hypothetical protein
MKGNAVMRRPSSPRRLLVVVVALFASMAVAAPALASEPQGPFSVFKECPRTTKGVGYCVYAQIESGEVKIGKTAVPINENKKSEIILQGGYERNESKEPAEEHFFGAENGETLSKTPQNVPGGLLDLINCTEITGEGFLEFLAREGCKAVFENKTTGVSATTELAKPASDIGINTDNLINEEGIALSLPVKVHLENTFLGSECYIGSSSEPVELALTDGETSPPKPNEPISGKLGHAEAHLYEGLPYLEITNNTLVNNSFSVPKASGCGGIFSSLVDPLVDSKLGLPSEAGNNTAVQTGKQKSATAKVVVASEKL